MIYCRNCGECICCADGDDCRYGVAGKHYWAFMTGQKKSPLTSTGPLPHEPRS